MTLVFGSRAEYLSTQTRQHHTTHGPPRRAFSCPAPVVSHNMWSLTAHMWSLTAHILALALALAAPAQSLEFLKLNDRSNRFPGQFAAPFRITRARQRFAPVNSNSILSFIKRINQRSNRLTIILPTFGCRTPTPIGLRPATRTEIRAYRRERADSNYSPILARDDNGNWTD
jgi:hypothetical protein